MTEKYNILFKKQRWRKVQEFALREVWKC